MTKKYSPEELKKILADHKLWLEGKGGQMADLSYADLQHCSLRGADLRKADLSFADLLGVSLRETLLTGAVMRYAEFHFADLRECEMGNCDLTYANFYGANLSNCNLEAADLSHANLNYTNLSNANFSEALTDFPIYQISGIGSTHRMTTYIPSWDKVFYGYFTGTMAEFVAKIEATHADNPQLLSEHRAAVRYFKELVEVANG